MASLGHVAIGLAAGRLYSRPRAGEQRINARDLAKNMVAFAVVGLLPDADVLSFPLGISYGAPFGHRGASHSLVAAIALGLVVWLAASFDKSPHAMRAALYAMLVMATHGPLDAMTDGGRGVALLWPFTTTRFFFPWRPIPVAPIGRGLFSQQGIDVLGFEFVTFLPFLIYAFVPRFWKKEPLQ